MIPVQRVQKPRILEENADRWLSELQAAIANPSSKPSEIEAAKSKYRHREVKQALEAMFSCKCAYCESSIRTVGYGDIEHFRPKSQFIERTFEWENLLYSCSICNARDNKGDKFPIDENGQPLLVNPTDEAEDPFLHLEFSWQDKTAFIDGKDERGNTVVDTFDLNGFRKRNDLIRQRSGYFRKLSFPLGIALEADDLGLRRKDPVAWEKIAPEKWKEAIEELKLSCQTTSEYRAFALAYILPYLAYYFDDLESIALLKSVIQRSSYLTKLTEGLYELFETESFKERAEKIKILKSKCRSDAGFHSFARFLIIPYLAHHFKDKESIEFIKSVSQKSEAYRRFAYADFLPEKSDDRLDE